MRKLLDVSPPGAPPYPVLCGRGAAAGLAEVWNPRWRAVALIADHHTDALFGDAVSAWLADRGCAVCRQTFPAGEQSKTRATKAQIEDAMLAAGIDRDGCVIALGGGVVLDLAGFVAATYLRGIDHVAIATSLLAQVDAAVGGKTAINTPLGKNLVGAFHHPRAVLLDLAALEHLPHDELRAGLAEAVKHALIADESLLGRIEAWAATTPEPPPLPEEVVTRSVAIKAEVVADDDRDRGRRHILNFGHTVAHAIEHGSGNEVHHGQAVAAGMIVEARAASQAGLFPAADVDRLVAVVAAIGLPTTPPCAFRDAQPYLARDKKTAAGGLRCALPQRIGRSGPQADGSWLTPLTEEALARAWEPGP